MLKNTLKKKLKVVFKTDDERCYDFNKEVEHYTRHRIAVDYYYDLNKMFYVYDKFLENFKKEVNNLTLNKKRAMHKDLFKSLEISHKKIIQEFKETSIHYFL